MSDIPPDAIGLLDETLEETLEAPADDKTCTECGKPFDTAAGMKRHRTRIHGPQPSEDAKPKSVAAARKTNLEKELAQFFTFIGLTVSVLDRFDGMTITNNAESLARAYSNLARQNKSVEKFLTGLLTTSAVGEVVMATAATVVPMLIRHQIIPNIPIFGVPTEPPAPEYGPGPYAG